MKRREFGVRFEYPAEQDSFFDQTSGEAFFFGKRHTAESVIKAVTHETIHFLVHQIKGTRASFKFDRICNDVEKWDKTVYRILY